MPEADSQMALETREGYTCSWGRVSLAPDSDAPLHNTDTMMLSFYKQMYLLLVI